MEHSQYTRSKANNVRNSVALREHVSTDIPQNQCHCGEDYNQVGGTESFLESFHDLPLTSLNSFFPSCFTRT